MRSFIYIIFLFLMLSVPGKSQVPALFENLSLGMSFSANTKWTCTSSMDDSILELINPNSNLSVKMWFEASGESAQNCLRSILEEDGISPEGPSFKTKVDSREATAYMALCCEKRRPMKMVIIAVKENQGYSIIRFKCPDECFREHQSHLDTLIGSVYLLKKAESHIFYAEQRRTG